jgi:hypothetical protein
MRTKPPHHARKSRKIRRTISNPYQPWNIQRHFFRQASPLPTRLSLIKAEVLRQKSKNAGSLRTQISQAEETLAGASSPLRDTGVLYSLRESRRWTIGSLVIGAWRRQHVRKIKGPRTRPNYLETPEGGMAEMDSGFQALVGGNVLMTDSMQEDRDSESPSAFVSTNILSIEHLLSCSSLSRDSRYCHLKSSSSSGNF